MANGPGSGRPGSGGRLTEYELRRLAQVRAEATGESVADVLRVFQGRGRYGPVSTATEAEQEPEAGAAGADSCALQDDPAAGLAPVIPLARARRAQGE